MRRPPSPRITRQGEARSCRGRDVGETLLSLGGFAEGKGLGNCDHRLSTYDSALQALEFADACHRVIGEDFDTRTLLGLGIDAIGVRYSPALSDGIDAALDFGTDQGENGIDALGREALRDGDDVTGPVIDDLVGAEPAGEIRSVIAGRGSENAPAMPLGELDGKAADAACCTVDDDAFALVEVDRVLDPLQSRVSFMSSRHCRCSSLDALTRRERSQPSRTSQ
jgi:hypothetical protein